MINWEGIKYFKEAELACKETGECNMNEHFMLKLDRLRDLCGFPFKITSGYRSPLHSLEKKKEKAGSHTYGRAVDIYVANSKERFLLISTAIALGFNRIGIADSFVHIDDIDTVDSHFPSNVIWGY